MTIGVFLLGLLIGTIGGILQMGRFEDDEDEDFSTDSDFPNSELEESK